MITKEELANKSNNLEKVIVSNSKRFFMRNRFKIYLLLILYLIQGFIIGLPYINLIINKQTALFLIVIFGLIIFKVYFRIYMILAIISMAVAFFYTLTNRDISAENFGNFAYVFIFMSVCRLIGDFMKGKG